MYINISFERANFFQMYKTEYHIKKEMHHADKTVKKGGRHEIIPYHVFLDCFCLLNTMYYFVILVGA